MELQNLSTFVDSATSPIQSQDMELWNKIQSTEDPQFRATLIEFMQIHLHTIAEKDKALAVAEARAEWEQKQRLHPSKIHRKPSSASLQTLQTTTYQQENEPSMSSYLNWWWWWRGDYDSKGYQPLKSHSS